MSYAATGPRSRTVVLVKHALPTLDPTVPAREWRLSLDGEAQARRLAAKLRDLLPFELVASSEPKAARTAALVGAELGLSYQTQPGLEEFDRPTLPLLSAAEHRALNAAIFSDLERPVLGRESGNEALRRFRTALGNLLDNPRSLDSLVVVSHGTVIALLVSAHNDTDGFELWQRLPCASFVVLSYPDFRLVRDVQPVA